MSCEELSESEPQLIFTNQTVASIMSWMFYRTVIKNEKPVAEVSFDILNLSARPITLDPKN